MLLRDDRLCSALAAIAATIVVILACRLVRVWHACVLIVLLVWSDATHLATSLHFLTFDSNWLPLEQSSLYSQAYAWTRPAPKLHLTTHLLPVVTSDAQVCGIGAVIFYGLDRELGHVSVGCVWCGYLRCSVALLSDRPQVRPSA